MTAQSTPGSTRESDRRPTDISRPEGTARVVAPFTAEQMQHLLDYQVSGPEPVVCPKDGSELFPTLENEGWVCQLCDFTQNWAPADMAEGHLSGTLAALLDDPLIGHTDHLRVQDLDPS